MDTSNQHRILHITNWYLTINEPKRALWIKDQIDLWKKFAEVDVWHIELLSTNRFSWAFKRGEQHSSLLIEAPIRHWILIELISFLMLLFVLIFKIKLRKYNAINFHIAYPLLTYWHIIESWVKVPVFVSEHWSAYHFHFNTSNPLHRIKRIFESNLRWIVVSHALGHDLIRFSANPNLYLITIPNVVDLETYQYQQKSFHQNSFFMLSQWKDPKDPFLILSLFKRLPSHFYLRIGGYGPQLERMKKVVRENNLEERVTFLGVLNKQEILTEFSEAAAFIHPSHYETFSVVCAESIACGCPVIASKVGGIPDFVNDSNGIVIDSNDPVTWETSISNFDASHWDRKQISEDAHLKFASSNLSATLKKEYEYAQG